MSPVIHRITLDVQDEQALVMHPAAQILSVAPTRDGGSSQIDLWFTAYPNDRTHSDRPVYMAGTGHPIPDGRFVGTVVTPSGLVWHVFEGDSA